MILMLEIIWVLCYLLVRLQEYSHPPATVKLTENTDLILPAALALGSTQPLIEMSIFKNKETWG
jgi:flagellar biogenesis protein FliO